MCGITGKLDLTHNIIFVGLRQYEMIYLNVQDAILIETECAKWNISPVIILEIDFSRLIKLLMGQREKKFYLLELPDDVFSPLN